MESTGKYLFAIVGLVTLTGLLISGEKTATQTDPVRLATNNSSGGSCTQCESTGIETEISEESDWEYDTTNCPACQGHGSEHVDFFTVKTPPATTELSCQPGGICGTASEDAFHEEVSGPYATAPKLSPAHAKSMLNFGGQLQSPGGSPLAYSPSFLVDRSPLVCEACPGGICTETPAVNPIASAFAIPAIELSKGDAFTAVETHAAESHATAPIATASDPASPMKIMQQGKVALRDVLTWLNTPVEIDVSGLKLAELAEMIQKETGLPITVDHVAIENADFQLDTVTFAAKAKGITLEALLNRVCTGPNLTWMIAPTRDHVIFTSALVQQQTLFTVAVPAAAIVGGDRAKTLRDDALNQFTEVLMSAAPANAWEGQGGTGTLRAILIGEQPVFFIRANSPTQLSVLRLCEQLGHSLEAMR